MSSPSPTSPATPPVAVPTFQQKLTKWAGSAIGIVFIIIAGTKLIGQFTLPSCDSSRATDTVRSIFKDKNLDLTALTDARTVSDASQEKTCTADYQLPDEKGALDYGVYGEGWAGK